MQIKVPGVDDRKLMSKREDRFTRAKLPAYMRRTPSIDNLVPTLYLSGVSTSAFQTAHASILGAGGRYCSNSRGLTTAPRLAIGDGALGFWNALDEIFPETKNSVAGSTKQRMC